MRWREFLFKAETPQEKAMRNVVWGSLDVKKIFEGGKAWDKLNDFASEAIKELADFKNIDEFEEFMRWFQIRTAANFKEVGVVDIM